MAPLTTRPRRAGSSTVRVRAHQPRLGAGAGARLVRRRRPGSVTSDAVPYLLLGAICLLTLPCGCGDPEAPRSEPRRDRAARLPRVPRARASSPSLSSRRTTAGRCTRARADETVEIAGYLDSGGAHPRREGAAPTRSTPATASSPRTPTSPRRSTPPGSSVGRPAARGAARRAATSSRRSGSRRGRRAGGRRRASPTRSASR